MLLSLALTKTLTRELRSVLRLSLGIFVTRVTAAVSKFKLPLGDEKLKMVLQYCRKGVFRDSQALLLRYFTKRDGSSAGQPLHVLTFGSVEAC